MSHGDHALHPSKLQPAPDRPQPQGPRQPPLAIEAGLPAVRFHAKAEQLAMDSGCPAEHESEPPRDGFAKLLASPWTIGGLGLPGPPPMRPLPGVVGAQRASGAVCAASDPAGGIGRKVPDRSWSRGIRLEILARRTGRALGRTAQTGMRCTCEDVRLARLSKPFREGVRYGSPCHF